MLRIGVYRMPGLDPDTSFQNVAPDLQPGMGKPVREFFSLESLKTGFFSLSSLNNFQYYISLKNTFYLYLTLSEM
mgnify:CR=1 FL=1